MPLYTLLRRFKWHGSEDVLAPLRACVASLVEAFLARHGACVAAAGGGPWDLVGFVPSTAGRTGRHPLEAALDSSELLTGRHASLLAPGPIRITHGRPDPSGFDVRAHVEARRVLLLDDTYASGARAQSAAHALHSAGAHVVAVVPVARIVDSSFSDDHAAFWKQVSDVPFDLETCCLEAGRPAATLAA